MVDQLEGLTLNEWALLYDWYRGKFHGQVEAINLENAQHIRAMWDAEDQPPPTGSPTDNGKSSAATLFAIVQAELDRAGLLVNPPRVVAEDGTSRSVFDLQPGTAPKVTPADIEAEIVSEHYFTAMNGVSGANEAKGIDGQIDFDTKAPDTLGLLNFCVLVLRNGFTVTGESACASPDNFDAEVGRKVARAAAVAQMWKLLGFRLRDRLSGWHYRQRVWDEDDRISAAVKQTSPAPVPVVVPEMVIFDVQVASDPVNDGMYLQVKARIGDEAKVCTMPFETGITKEETTANKQAAHAKAVSNLEEAFGISRQQDA